MNDELMRKIDNIHDNLVPFVIEKTGRGERSYDIFSRLLKDRIVFIGDAIHDHTANLVIAQILFLVSDNRNQDINIYINSPGGSVTAGLAIYDTMQFVQCDIATFCIGQASSMGAVLLPPAFTLFLQRMVPLASTMLNLNLNVPSTLRPFIATLPE